MLLTQGNTDQGSYLAIIVAGCPSPKNDLHISYVIFRTRNSSVMPKLCRYSWVRTVNKNELYCSEVFIPLMRSKIRLFTIIMLEPSTWYAPKLPGIPCNIRQSPALCILNLCSTASFTSSKASLKSRTFSNLPT